MDINRTKVGNYIINGFNNEYIFETIKKTEMFYENDLLINWDKYIQKHSVILDIGANIGNHSICWCKNASKIYAFEPQTDNFKLLTANILDNNINNVFTINKCVGKNASKATISFIDDKNMGSTSFKYDEEATNFIEVTSVDIFVEENNINKIDFIKIDTEGFEIDVLLGALQTITFNKPVLWVEIKLDTYKQVLQILKDINYTLVDINAFNFLLLPNEKCENLEIITFENVLNDCLSNLTGKYNYYTNYCTAKEWHQTSLLKNQKLLEEKEKNSELILQLKQQIEDQKQQIEDQKNNLLELENQKIEAINHIAEVFNNYDNQILLLKNAQKHIKKLEAKNAYLCSENESYRKKLAKITDTWYGNLAVKAYKLLQKIKRKLRR